MDLSSEKKAVLGVRGLVAVRAGPGSGKTLLLAKRLADTLHDWRAQSQGVAVMSFTNVAHEEIQRQAREEFGVQDPLRYPHFLGTIDSFVNEYVFLPFGHLSMGIAKRPDLVGPPHGWFPNGPKWAWGNQECYEGASCRLPDFTYDIHGNLLNQRPRSQSRFAKCRQNHRACLAMRALFAKAGYATQSDANYYAMRLLHERPQIAKALVRRFPVVMVDEAQDSSDIQMQIIEILVRNGLREVFMVGDPDQAIYEWRAAKPELFRQKCSEWSPNLDPLRENWRSSQVICDFASLVSSMPCSQMAMRADVKDMKRRPLIRPYEVDALPSEIESFLAECHSNGIELQSSKVAIVARSGEIVRVIRTGHAAPKPPLGEYLSPWPDRPREARDIALCAFLFRHKHYGRAMRRMMRVACSLETKVGLVTSELADDFVERHGFGATRAAVFGLLNSLPEASGMLSRWCLAAHPEFERFCRCFLKIEAPCELKVKTGREHQEYYNSLDFLDEFSDELDDANTTDYHVGTVHSVKGWTVDALLLVLKKQEPKTPYYPKLVKERMANRACEMQEAIRILYVAFTRPKKLLTIAVPTSELEKWREVLPGYVPTEQ